MNDATPKLDCRGARGLAIDAQLGQLDDAGRAALDRHLAGCEGCRHEVAALQQTVALLRRPALVAPSAGFAARVGRLLDEVDAAGRPRRFAERERASVRLLDHARFRLVLLGHQLRHSRRWQLRVAAALLPLLIGIALLLRVPVAPAAGEVATRPESASPGEGEVAELLPPAPDLAPWRPKFDDPVDLAPAEPPTPVEELAARDPERVQQGLARANELDEAALAQLRAARRSATPPIDAPSADAPAPAEREVVVARTPVQRALDWLGRNQRLDGSWTSGNGTPGIDTGVTALALLALLSDGHLGVGGEAPLDAAATRAVAWLAAQQEADGRFRGGGDAAAQKVCHALATLALVERHVRLRALDPKSTAASAAHHDRLEQALSVVEIGLDQAFHDAAQSGSGAIAAWSSLALATARHGGLDFHLKASSEALAEKMTAQVRPDRADLLAAASHAVLAMADREPGGRDPAWSRAVGDVVKELGRAEPSLRFLVASALASGSGTTRDTWQQFERALEQQLLPQQAPNGYFESGASWDELDGGVAGETALAALALQVERRQREFAAARKALGQSAPRKRGG